MARFITQMLRGEQPTIYGDGQQSRDFTYVENAVHANLLACSAPAERVVGQTFNVACGRRIDLNTMFRALQQLTGFTGTARYTNERAADVKHSLADLSKAKSALGYEPTVDFEDGLRLTVEWYRSAPVAAAD